MNDGRASTSRRTRTPRAGQEPLALDKTPSRLELMVGARRGVVYTGVRPTGGYQAASVGLCGTSTGWTAEHGPGAQVRRGPVAVESCLRHCRRLPPRQLSRASPVYASRLRHLRSNTAPPLPLTIGTVGIGAYALVEGAI